MKTATHLKRPATQSDRISLSEKRESSGAAREEAQLVKHNGGEAQWRAKRRRKRVDSNAARHIKPRNARYLKCRNAE